MRSPVTVACVQAEPAILDRDGTLERLDGLTAKAASGAELVLLPEAFVPGYPSNRWVRFLAAGRQPTPISRISHAARSYT